MTCERCGKQQDFGGCWLRDTNGIEHWFCGLTCRQEARNAQYPGAKFLRK